VIIEPTGGYERRLLKELFAGKIPVSIVNPYYVRNFAKAKQDLAKTDKIDAKVLSEYGEKMEPKMHEMKEEYRFEIEDLTHRRDNLVEVLKDEKLRLEKSPSEEILNSIRKHLDFLKDEIKIIEKKILEMISTHASKESEVL
jgi:transposase